MKYKDFETLKKNKDFQNVYKKKKSFANKSLVMYVTENNYAINRLGISVSKKVGNSVIRHRLGRRIREAYRINSEKVTESHDIVVIAREELKKSSYAQTETSLIYLLKKHGLMDADKKMHQEEV